MVTKTNTKLKNHIKKISDEITTYVSKEYFDNKMGQKEKVYCKDRLYNRIGGKLEFSLEKSMAEIIIETSLEHLLEPAQMIIIRGEDMECGIMKNNDEPKDSTDIINKRSNEIAEMAIASWMPIIKAEGEISKKLIRDISRNMSTVFDYKHRLHKFFKLLNNDKETFRQLWVEVVCSKNIVIDANPMEPNELIEFLDKGQVTRSKSDTVVFKSPDQDYKN